MAGAEYPQPYGDYVLLERLGVGGMSEVDLARKAVEDTEFIRFCVIKRIKADRTDDDAFVRMFKDEARITAELNHPNIALVYDFGRRGDEYYLALEYVPGVDLRRLITGLRNEGERIPLRVGLKILADVLDGLGYAHDKVDALGRPMNVVHRDVNPRNVMVSVRGEVKLIDFGVAKATNRLERTRTDHVKGKFQYMAPEQIAAEDVDRRADLFAVGLMLHEIVTGYGPFEGLSQVQIMHRLVAGQMPDLPPSPDLKNPWPLVDLHRKALASKAADRYQTAAEFKAALIEVAQPLGGLATQADVAALLSRVDPLLASRIRDKAESYSGPLHNDIKTVPMPTLNSLVEPIGVDASLSGSRSVTRTVVAGSVAIGAGAALLAMLGIVLAVAVAAFLSGWTPGGGPATPEPQLSEIVSPPEPEPVPEPVPVVEVAPAPVPDVDPEPAPAPGPVPTVVPGPRVAPVVVVRPVPAPEPVPEPLPAPVAEPEPSGTADDPIVLTRPDPVPEPAPAPAPAPRPEPVALGTLQVNSTVRGLRISIDGRPTDHVTPATFQWPVGTVTVSVEGFSKSTTVREGVPTVVLLQ